jgi:PTS system nitrogen regulatory IIA component
MNIKAFLSSSDVLLDLRARDKVAVLEELSSRAAAVLNLPAEVITHEIERREVLGSTGIGGGVSMPHARFREVKKPFGLLARLKQLIDFEAIDGQPVDLVFLLLLPASSQLDQLNTLAAVARKLRDPRVLHDLRMASTPSELYKAVAA